jgi:hypothetical protein
MAAQQCNNLERPHVPNFNLNPFLPDDVLDAVHGGNLLSGSVEDPVAEGEVGQPRCRRAEPALEVGHEPEGVLESI